jgi:hypothetical protein
MFGTAPEKSTGLFGVQSFTSPMFGGTATTSMFNNAVPASTPF